MQNCFWYTRPLVWFIHSFVLQMLDFISCRYICSCADEKYTSVISLDNKPHSFVEAIIIIYLKKTALKGSFLRLRSTFNQKQHTISSFLSFIPDSMIK